MKKFEKSLPITDSYLQEQNQKYYSKNCNNILRHALSNTTITSLALGQDVSSKNDFNFTIDIKTMKATNQKASGRCWIFAACNVLREIIAKKCKIKEFELSQSYVAFYDRLEKINYALESIIDFVDAEHDDRTLEYIIGNGLCDGGQWDMFVNIVKKYGIVPKNVMPETFQSSNTGLSNNLINCQLRKFAAVSKHLYQAKGIEAVYAYKNELLDKLYRLLLNCHGVPTQKFDFEYVDENNNYHLEKDYTPKTFFDKYIGSWIDEYVSVINAPTADKPFNKTYTIDYLGNVIEGKEITHLNVDVDRFKELTLAQIKDGEVTWFGSDCGKYSDREKGIWDDQSWDYQSLFGLDYDINKTDALDYKVSVMNHAMVLCGVALDDNKPTKWKVQNSWGTDKAFNGYYVMSDTWFDKFVYQVVINKKYLNEEELKALENKPIRLKPWDPMGSLAE